MPPTIMWHLDSGEIITDTRAVAPLRAHLRPRSGKETNGKSRIHNIVFTVFGVGKYHHSDRVVEGKPEDGLGVDSVYVFRIQNLFHVTMVFRFATPLRWESKDSRTIPTLPHPACPHEGNVGLVRDMKHGNRTRRLLVSPRGRRWYGGDNNAIGGK